MASEQVKNVMTSSLSTLPEIEIQIGVYHPQADSCVKLSSFSKPERICILPRPGTDQEMHHNFIAKRAVFLYFRAICAIFLKHASVTSR